MLIRSLFTLALLMVSAPGVALATHGGPTTLEVLGQDGDQKVYLLRHSEGGADAPPELVFFRLDRPGARLHEATSFSRNPEIGFEELATFATRLKAFKQRLAPLTKASAAEWSVTSEARGKEPCPRASWERRQCAVWDVRFDAAGQQAHRRFYAWPGRRRVVSAWRLGDGSVLLIYRYPGVIMEGGYARDAAVLVRPTPPSKTAQPWSHGCSKSQCGVKVGARYVIKAPPGLINCVAQDGWLGCLYAPIETAQNEGWFVRLADGQVTEFGAEWEIETRGPSGDTRALSVPRWDAEFLVWRGKRFRRPPQ